MNTQNGQQLKLSTMEWEAEASDVGGRGKRESTGAPIKQKRGSWDADRRAAVVKREVWVRGTDRRETESAVG
jgi:hypothetical protein